MHRLTGHPQAPPAVWTGDVWEVVEAPPPSPACRFSPGPPLLAPCEPRVPGSPQQSQQKTHAPHPALHTSYGASQPQRVPGAHALHTINIESELAVVTAGTPRHTVDTYSTLC